MRGDVPAELDKQDVMDEFSPRARGCSAAMRNADANVSVFPACAGMFLCLNPWAGRSWSFPRVRGDVPVPVWRQICAVHG